MACHVARVHPAGHAPFGRQGAVQVPSRGRHVEVPGPPDLAPAPDLHQVRRDGLQRSSGRILPHGPAQVHARSSLAAGHPLRIELKLKADQRAAATATAFRVLLVDPQTQQFSQLGLNWLQYTLVQVAGAIGLRHVQQATELLKAHLPHAGLSILLQTAIRLLHIAGLQGRELGQFEARELRREVVEQEREARVDRDQ